MNCPANKKLTTNSSSWILIKNCAKLHITWVAMASVEKLLFVVTVAIISFGMSKGHLGTLKHACYL
jgi:hypothetical protein